MSSGHLGPSLHRPLPRPEIKTACPHKAGLVTVDAVLELVLAGIHQRPLLDNHVFELGHCISQSRGGQRDALPKLDEIRRLVNVVALLVPFRVVPNRPVRYVQGLEAPVYWLAELWNEWLRVIDTGGPVRLQKLADTHNVGNVQVLEKVGSSAQLVAELGTAVGLCQGLVGDMAPRRYRVGGDGEFLQRERPRRHGPGEL